MNTDARPDFGFVRVAAAVPPLEVADIDFNLQQILDLARRAERRGRAGRRLPRTEPDQLHGGRPVPPAPAAGPRRRRAAGARGRLLSHPAAARRRLPAGGRGQPVQHGGGRRPGRHPRPGAEDLHPRLQGVLRGAVVRLGSRPGGNRSAAGRPGGPRWQRPALPRERVRRPRHRRRDLRGPVGAAPSQLVPGPPRRASDRQPVGLQRTGREGGLPPIAGRPTVGPGPLRLRICIVRRRRIEPGCGLRRTR